MRNTIFDTHSECHCHAMHITELQNLFQEENLFRLFSLKLCNPFFSNIWWPMPLFFDIYFIYRYSMEVDEEHLQYNISVGVCLWFCRLDVSLQLGCIGAVLMRLY